MHLKNLALASVTVVLMTACSQEKTEAGAATNTPARPAPPGVTASELPSPTPAGKGRTDTSLLLRVQFAGTTAWLANTNAAYLTNFSTLPETAALGTQIVAKIASLPGRLVGERGAGAFPRTNGSANADGAHGVTRPTTEEALRPVFAEMMRSGFTLELRGTSNGVTDFAVAARENAALAAAWNEAWTNVGKERVAVERRDGWLLAAGSKTTPANALGELRKTLAGPGLASSNVVEGELSSFLVPGPIQRSVYGGFDRFKLSASPVNQALRVHGTATYKDDLPKLGQAPSVPTNLVTETAVSFTLVRNPGAWLEPNSALHPFLPSPIPDTAFFWGGESSPYQLFMAMPSSGRDEFNTNFGPRLQARLTPVAKFIDSGTVTLDTNLASLRMLTVPFVSPKAQVKESGTNFFIVAEAFPAFEGGGGLTPALVERVSGRTNLMLYDWEYTQLRIDTWLQIGLLALFTSGHQQHMMGTPSSRWIQAAQSTATAINTSTEITQTGPRELTLRRSAPLAFNSLELFWLANWLESANFPRANFLMPIPPDPSVPVEPAKEEAK